MSNISTWSLTLSFSLYHKVTAILRKWKTIKLVLLHDNNYTVTNPATYWIEAENSFSIIAVSISNTTTKHCCHIVDRTQIVDPRNKSTALHYICACTFREKEIAKFSYFRQKLITMCLVTQLVFDLIGFFTIHSKLISKKNTSKSKMYRIDILSANSID